MNPVTFTESKLLEEIFELMKMDQLLTKRNTDSNQNVKLGIYSISSWFHITENDKGVNNNSLWQSFKNMPKSDFAKQSYDWSVWFKTI